MLLAWQIATLAFKIGYYEEVIKQKRKYFTKPEFTKIENIMKINWLTKLK